MKNLLLILSVVISQGLFAQSVSADLYVGQPYLTDANGGPVDANGIGLGSIVKMHVDFLNLEQNKSVPTNTFQIIIGLGDKLQVASGYDLANAPMSNYFTWITSMNNGQQQIIGTLNSTLPADFAGLGVFDLQATTLGNSTSVSQLALSNFNPSANLTDPDPSNNNAQMGYSVTAVLPVTFTDFNVSTSGCDISARWKVEQQRNIDRYEVEISKTGTEFSKVTTLISRNTNSYQSEFTLSDQIKAAVVYVRIKAVGVDGSYFYTSVRAIDGDCNRKQPWQLYVYPNPITNVEFINVAAREGTLDGKYRLTLLDNFGKVYQIKDMTFSNVKNFRYNLNPLMGAGKYVLNVSKSDGTNSTSMEFEKLQ